MPATNLERVFSMTFSRIYPLYIAKVERKGRTRDDVDTVISWLTGFSPDTIHELGAETSTVTLREFFDRATLNPASTLLTGSVCGVKIQEVEDPLMRKIRYMDKLVDDVAKGRKLDRMLPSLDQE